MELRSSLNCTSVKEKLSTLLSSGVETGKLMGRKAAPYVPGALGTAAAIAVLYAAAQTGRATNPNCIPSLPFTATANTNDTAAEAVAYDYVNCGISFSKTIALSFVALWILKCTHAMHKFMMNEKNSATESQETVEPTLDSGAELVDIKAAAQVQDSADKLG